MSDQNMSSIATYADRAGADLLAKFLTAAGIQCYVTTPASAGVAGANVSVPSELVGTVARILDLTELTQYDDPTSAEVVAGRLICENVPCVLGGMATLEHFGFVGGLSGPYTLSVPKTSLTEAKRILDEAPVSDSELTELALRSVPEVDDSK
jgi:hypothetical protein